MSPLNHSFSETSLEIRPNTCYKIFMHECSFSAERKITETNELSDNGEHSIYENWTDKDACMVAVKQMHVFFCADPGDMHETGTGDQVR